MLVKNTMTNVGTSEEPRENNEELMLPLGFDTSAPFRLEPMRRLEDRSMIQLMMGESLSDIEATKGIIDSYIPLGMVVEARGQKSSVRISLLKEVVVVLASATLAMEKEVKILMQEYTLLEDLAESKLQRVEKMGLTLIKEKTTQAQF